jgi:hypothetical protein
VVFTSFFYFGRISPKDGVGEVMIEVNNLHIFFWEVSDFCVLIFTKELISKSEDILVTEVLVGKIFGF